MTRASSILFCALLLLASCAKDEVADGFYSSTEWTQYTVAVVAPLSESAEYKERIERITDWFTENFHKGQMRMEKGVSLKLEWYDESAMSIEEIKQLGRDFAGREDLAAVVGPFYSTSVDALCSKMYLAGIPIFAPVTTSEDVQRRYAVSSAGVIQEPFLWCMSGCDVTQSEALMDLIVSYGYKDYEDAPNTTVALIAPDDIYGKTFTEWLPYQAVGMELDLKANIQYDSGKEESIAESVESLSESEAEYAVVAAATVGDAREFLRLSREKKDMPRLFFTDATFNAELLAEPSLAEGAEGMTMYADPESGFQAAYEARYGALPVPDECMLYDALMLCGMACEYSLLTGEEDLNAIVSRFSGIKGTAVNVWNADGMEVWLSKCGSDETIRPLRGVSGTLSFDPEAHTSRILSHYAHWRVYEGQFVILCHITSNPYETTASWNSISMHEYDWEDFDEDVDITYGNLTDRWAVLVCGSTGWQNYRHSADVLGVYRMMKRSGYDDDHIILVLTDDLSSDSRNIYPGEIRSTPDGDNLLKDVKVDYTQQQVSAQDICDILLGNKSDRLPVVVESGQGSNIFFYWSGHGSVGNFNYTTGGDFTSEMLSATVRQMSDRQRFRQMLICAEPCHSSSVVRSIESIPGVLGIASAYDTESSFADVYNAQMGIWMSDRFSNNLIHKMSGIDAYISYTYQELYQHLWQNTIGSHVKVFNADCFGNLYKMNCSDFFYGYEE